MNYKISCIISCFNEEKNIPKLLLDIRKFKLENKIKFIIVNNGSSDNSGNVIKKFKRKFKKIKFINIEKNKGWGNGIYQGLKNSKTPIVGWTHGDLEYKISDLKKVLKIIESKTFVNKIKKNFIIKGERINRNFTKKIFSVMMEVLCSIILLKSLKDINAQPFFCNIDEFKSWKKIPCDLSLDMFAYYKLIAKKAHVYRIKVTQKNRIHGTSSWNKGFLSKFYLSVLFIKRDIQIKLCRYF